MRYLRPLATTLQVVLLLVLGASALRAITRPDPMEQYRRAEALLADGQYHHALQAYLALADQQPSGPILLRLGILHALRGEHRRASDDLRRALRRPLPTRDRELAYLYLARAQELLGEARYAENSLGQVHAAAALYPLRLVLVAEAALAAQEYAAAEVQLRQARDLGLPTAWQAHANYRLALLIAGRDPTAAQALLAATNHAQPDPLQAALLPLTPASRAAQAARLAQVLGTEPPSRDQLLGQFYLEARLYALADAAFAAVPTDSAEARAAAAFAAYTRWEAGDREEGMRRLQQLVERHPDDRRARSLLAVAYLQLRQPDRAAAQLDAIGRDAPGDPMVYFAWGRWFFLQRDYPQAAEEYRRAIDHAPAAERGGYAVTAARFHLSSGYAVCDEGRPVAQQATQLSPERAEAWLALAAISYHCNAPRAARTAAAESLRLAPASAEASYYLGVSLAALGDAGEARQALTRAADLEPASVWRVRAETQLQQLRG
jgi:Flp pilus assembly protein TadD